MGQKEWILIPPGKESELLMPDGHLPFDIKPKMKSREFRDNLGVIEVVQDAGQMIFVPSGWIHQVLNTKDTISINHNWFNACNISFVYDSLQEALFKVRKELQDLRSGENCSSWDEDCQTLLRLHHGMNTSDFCDILEMVLIRLRAESQIENVPFQIQHEIESLRHFLRETEICDELKTLFRHLFSESVAES